MNNIAETINYLNNRRKNDEIAIHALKKQIRMQVRREAGFYGPIPYCPICNSRLAEFDYDNYCSNCGQALDWSED